MFEIKTGVRERFLRSSNKWTELLGQLAKISSELISEPFISDNVFKEQISIWKPRGYLGRIFMIKKIFKYKFFITIH